MDWNGMRGKSFQRQIDGGLAERVRADKSRRMNGVDFGNYDLTAPFGDGSESLIYKKNLPEFLAVVTYSATEDDPDTPAVLVNLGRNGEIYEASPGSGSVDVFREVCRTIESRNSVEGLSESFGLARMR